MMFSVPDTAFGAAVAKFLLLFQQRPVSLAELHAAFADVSTIAARDHPERPWPIKQTGSDGLTSTLTVDGWLAIIRRSYSSLPIREDAVMAEKLALWQGAKATVTVASHPWPTELQLHFTKRIRPGTGIAYNEPLGALVASCSWVLWRGSEVVASSASVDSLAIKKYSAMLKGAEVLAVRLELGGILVVVLTKGLRAEVRPNDFSVGPDYSLHLGSHFYYRFDGNFVESEQISMEDTVAFE